MNVRNFKKRSMTDWARIDQMTDEEIDTSEIPPLNEEFFARAKWRLPRLYIDRFDFLQARAFARYILRNKLHEARKSKDARVNRELVHLAFNTSLILSYSRPFHWNENFRKIGEPKSSLRRFVNEVLDETEAKFHREILSQRNTIYAHSPASTHRFEGLDYSKLVALFKVTKPLGGPETARLSVMIDKWIKYLDGKISLLKPR